MTTETTTYGVTTHDDGTVTVVFDKPYRLAMPTLGQYRKIKASYNEGATRINDIAASIRGAMKQASDAGNKVTEKQAMIDLGVTEDYDTYDAQSALWPTWAVIFGECTTEPYPGDDALPIWAAEAANEAMNAIFKHWRTVPLGRG